MTKLAGDISRPDDEQLEEQNGVANSAIGSIAGAEWFCVVTQQGLWTGSPDI